MSEAGYEIRPGWKAPIKHYWIRCAKHGKVKTYPMGYEMLLLCPKCIEEESRGVYSISTQKVQEREIK